jgi:uncharacterized membrane protein
MSSEPDDLRQQLVALNERVAKLEARLAETPPAAAGKLAVPVPNSGRSLESRIGSQLFNRIGIVAMLIGVAWFLKFAIDNHWIGPPARVLIGLIAGAGLITWSERFRSRGFSGFSLSLKAIGTGVLYLSLWAAFALFHLIPGEVAFVAMVLVTAWNAWMCWTQNSEALAFYAAVGGFITPVLLSNGESHELALFGYLLILDLAVLALVALRPWSRLLLAVFAGTVFYVATWSIRYYSSAQFSSTATCLSIFFLLFAAAPRVSRMGAQPQAAMLVALTLANATLGFFGFYLLLDDPGGAATQAGVAVAFAAFYLLLRSLPTRFALSSASQVHDGFRKSHDEFRKSLDLAIAIAYFGFALARAIHVYWWQTRYNGDRSLLHDYRIYAQFTYSASFMVFGALLLLLGFARSSAFLRWQALCILAITIGKVFLVDMSQLSQGYRILSFLGLGALLLTVSFVYQKDWLSLRRQSAR